MITVLSPAKTLDFSTAEVADYQTPRLLEESTKLIKILKNYYQLIFASQRYLGTSNFMRLICCRQKGPDHS